MASFIEELWTSIFTPGTTPTLLIATNASFAALQLLLLLLLIATYSIHFLILSIICMGLWAAINWFARELQIEKDKADERLRVTRGKSPDTANGSDTETELEPQPQPQPQPQSKLRSHPPPQDVSLVPEAASTQVQPDLLSSAEALRRRRSLGDSSGYVSTDSEWEKVSGS